MNPLSDIVFLFVFLSGLLCPSFPQQNLCSRKALYTHICGKIYKLLYGSTYHSSHSQPNTPIHYTLTHTQHTKLTMSDFSDFSDDEDIYCCDCDCLTTSSNHSTTKTAPPSKTSCRFCSEPYHWNPAIGHWCCSCGIQKSGMEYSDQICEICEIVRSPGGRCQMCARCGLRFNTQWTDQVVFCWDKVRDWCGWSV